MEGKKNEWVVRRLEKMKGKVGEEKKGQNMWVDGKEEVQKKGQTDE